MVRNRALVELIIRGPQERAVWEAIKKLDKPVFRNKDLSEVLDPPLPRYVVSRTLSRLESKGLIRKIDTGTWRRVADDIVVVGAWDITFKRLLDAFLMALSGILMNAGHMEAGVALLGGTIVYSIALEVWLRRIPVLGVDEGQGGSENQD